VKRTENLKKIKEKAWHIDKLYVNYYN
jgi:hypothetical protein